MTRQPTIFLGVGATKAGTTWLYRFLAAHPECHLRTIKELHYFDTAETGNFDRQIRLTRERAEAAEPGSPQARDLADWAGVLDGRGADPAAYLGYLTEGRGDRAVVGEITPAYALLPVDRLRAMARLAADVRFVYLMRDPLARLWSQIRMLAVRKARSAGEVPVMARRLMERALAGLLPDAVARGDYAGAMARLRAAVAPDRLLIQFHEDLMTLPGIARLCAFLGIADRPAPFDRHVHEGAHVRLDPDLAARARAMLRPQYECVATAFSALPEAWRRNMDEVTP